MKNIIITAILTLIVSLGFGQNKEILRNQADFTKAMQDYIAAELNDADKMKAAREQYGHSCVPGVTVSDDDIRREAGDAAKHDFIRTNIERYMALYFPESKVISDTFACDNGGFEDDFLYYSGFSSTFTNGSNTCNPKNGGTPSVFIPVSTLPTLKEFEIVTSGIDPITGLQKVKFGNKALKLNDPYSHIDGGCNGHRGVNKLVKRFKVTSDNRDLTVWYSIALENPPGHLNTQPFFSIKCDLAPFSDLCFDAHILDCDSLYSQPGCSYALMDVLDWTCHKIKIPMSEVGKIATIEITMGDCGESAHNGYAYIDGFCEECENSLLGSILIDSIDYLSCHGEKARICGSYIEPNVCGEWYLDSVSVPGKIIENISIDTINKRYCFDLPVSNLDLYTTKIFVAGFFKKKGGGYLPTVFSNTIIIKTWDYKPYHTIDAIVNECHNNNTPNNISDDYYYVTFKIQTYQVTDTWELSKQLLDPYPNESGFSILGSGMGTDAITVGPFFIQEGSWEATVTIGECVYKLLITPPDYCSGCEIFRKLKISKFQCIAGSPDTWSFDINVPYAGGGQYELIPSSTASKNYNQTYTIYPGNIGTECMEYILKTMDLPTCEVTFTVCPPKPCDVECDIEITNRTWSCEMDLNGNYQYYVHLEGSGYTCYSVDGGTLQLFPSTGIIGPFTTDVTLVLYYCPAISINPCADCDDSDCYKVLKIFEPDCENNNEPNNPMPVGRIISNAGNEPQSSEVKVIPNPIERDMLRIVSGYEKTSIDIIDINGRLLDKVTFEAKEHIMDVSRLTQGSYFIRYRDNHGKIRYIHFVKL
ncbi:MAG: T9SS type A sorting domain-containing protein [Chitinophagales bacterium]|nr:T9SS type A sorting domain-containing protein [Chitinophagales bacterium]